MPCSSRANGQSLRRSFMKLVFAFPKAYADRLASEHQSQTSLARTTLANETRVRPSGEALSNACSAAISVGNLVERLPLQGPLLFHRERALIVGAFVRERNELFMSTATVSYASDERNGRRRFDAARVKPGPKKRMNNRVTLLSLTFYLCSLWILIVVKRRSLRILN